MRVIIAKDQHAVGAIAATLIAAQVLEKPDCVLGLSTGASPLPTYAELARMHREGIVDFSRITSFNLDEYVGLPITHPESYHAFMWRNLFSLIQMRREQVHLPDGNAADLHAEAAAYEARILAAGGVDLQLVGIGLNGHIGFNEPEDIYQKHTHVVALSQSTIQANRRFFDTEAEVPTRAITMGVHTIQRARKVVMVACGEGKAAIVRTLVEGDTTPRIPASVLQLHPCACVVLDEAAASHLTK